MKLLARIAVVLGMGFAAFFSHAQNQVGASAEFSRGELEQMLAPIALYPDTVLSHILIAATYPLEVVQADRWARANSQLDAQTAVNSVADKGWDPSVQALVAFPQLLQRMSEDLEWTQRLGDAMLADEAELMDAIQELRQRAYAAGSLNNAEHVRVQKVEQKIIIEPAVERVVHIPFYNTVSVYGHWHWSSYPPVVWHYPTHHIHTGHFSWGPRVYLGPSFFFSSVHWTQRRVVVIDYHRHHHPRFYSGRRISHYDGARHWQHNPTHRRGVVYRSERVREHYLSDRQGLRGSLERRDGERRPPRSATLESRQSLKSRYSTPRQDVTRTDRQLRLENPRSSTLRDTETPQRDRAERVRQRLSAGADVPLRRERDRSNIIELQQSPGRDESLSRGERPDRSGVRTYSRPGAERPQDSAGANELPAQTLPSREGPPERSRFNRPAPQSAPAEVRRPASTFDRSSRIEQRREQRPQRSERPSRDSGASMQHRPQRMERSPAGRPREAGGRGRAE